MIGLPPTNKGKGSGYTQQQLFASKDKYYELQGMFLIYLWDQNQYVDRTQSNIQDVYKRYC